MIKVNNQDQATENVVRFVCISDTHSKMSKNIPEGDVLIHAGDLTRSSGMKEFVQIINWLSKLPHKIKIITAGNHDHYLDSTLGFLEERKKILLLMKEKGLIYLEHEYYQLPLSMGGFKLFVSPYTPIHFFGAFMVEDLFPIWKDINEPIDILVTHTPPFGYLDQVKRNNASVGCIHLRNKIENDIKPKVHVFGHIHEAHGYFINEKDQLFINASMSDHRYRLNQKPITFDITI